MELIKYIMFKAGFTFYYHDSLNSIRTRPKIFSTSLTNRSEYDHWTFSNKYIWDDFYYADSSLLLIDGHTINIGKSNLLQTSLPISILQIIKIGMASGKSILGIPIGFKDLVHDHVIFQPATQNVDQYGKLLAQQPDDFTNRNVVIKWDVNYKME